MATTTSVGLECLHLLDPKIFSLPSFNEDRIDALKYFFGLSSDVDGANGVLEENIKYVQDMCTLLSSKITDDEYAVSSHLKATLHQVYYIYL